MTLSAKTPDLLGLLESVRRFDCLAVMRATTGRIEAMSLWAGESVGAVKRVQPTADILRELVDDAAALLHASGATLPGPVTASAS